MSSSQNVTAYLYCDESNAEKIKELDKNKIIRMVTNV